MNFYSVELSFDVIYKIREVLKHNPDVAQSIESMAESHERKVEKNLFKN